MSQRRCVLHDEQEVFDIKYMTPDELEDANRKAQEATAGNVWWTVTDEPVFFVSAK